MNRIISKSDIHDASQLLKKTGAIKKTSFFKHDAISDIIGCNVYIKNEGEQDCGSYKCRGAMHNMMKKIEANPDCNNFICVSAGNHSQGFSMSCSYFKKHGVIFMPEKTPSVKVEGTKKLGIGEDGTNYVEIFLTGETYDDAFAAAMEFMNKNNGILIHAFEDVDTIAGQGTIAAEICEQLQKNPDFIFVPVGGGGLAAGLCSYFASDDVKIIGCEPLFAASTTASLVAGQVVKLNKISHYIEGAAVQKMGGINFNILKGSNFHMRTIDDSQVHYALSMLYHDGIKAEGAGSIALAGLLNYDNLDELKGKDVVLILSGSNLDRDRMIGVIEQAKEMSEFPINHSYPKYSAIR